MKAYPSLPDNYEEIYQVDLEKNKKLSFILNSLSCLVGFVMLLVAIIAKGGFYDSMNIPQLLMLFAFNFLYIILHELTHGITMKLAGTKKVKYGWKGVYAYAGSSDFYNKKAYITIALAPVVIWGIVFGVLSFFATDGWWWIVYLLQLVNITGAVGDFFVTLKFMKMPKDILIGDHGVGMAVYAPSN